MCPERGELFSLVIPVKSDSADNQVFEYLGGQVQDGDHDHFDRATVPPCQREK